jgi:sucrose phosphorylase
VVNHLSAASPWFERYLAGDPRFARFFATLDPSVDASAVVRPRTSPLLHPFTRSDGTTVHVWTTFSADQVDLDYRNPAVLTAMSEVIGRFVDAGVAAVRLDAIAFVWKDPATSSVNLAGTHEVVRALRADIDRRRPGVLVVTETNLPHDQNVSYLAPGEAGAVYQFPLPPLVAHTFIAEDAGALVRWLQALTFPEPPATYLDVLATHDGIGVRGAEGWLDDVGVQRLLDATHAAGGVVNRRTTVDGDVPYELAVSWFALLGAGFDEATAIDRHLASHAIALAVRGHPLLYLNSLFGVGNDEATFARTGHARDLNRGRLRRTELDAALGEPSSRASRVWAGLRSMLAARASSTAFHPAAAQVVHERNPSVVLVERVAASGERAWVAVNVTRSPIDVDSPDSSTLTLAPFGWYWRTARFTAAASGCHDRR